MPPGRLFDGQIPPIELCYDQERDPYYNPGLNGDGLETRVMDVIEKLRVELKAMKGDGLEAEEMALYPDVCLPIGFQMPRIQQFEGKNTEDPKAHLKAYMRTMQAYRCKEPEFALLFHHSLSGFARRWFLNLNPLQVSKWGDIVKEFYGRFGDNDSALVTKSRLEATCQGEKESFADFVARWQELASQLDDKLKEEELVDMIRNNFRPAVKEKLGIMHIPDFRVLLSVGAKIEKNETSQCHKKNGSPTVNFVQSARNQPKREFTTLPSSLGNVFTRLQKRGLLSSLTPKPPPSTLPAWWDEEKMCEYHQSRGHATDDCITLKHHIQNLIDQGKVNVPPPPPHVQYGQVNMLGTEEGVEDPVSLIQPISKAVDKETEGEWEMCLPECSDWEFPDETEGGWKAYPEGGLEIPSLRVGEEEAPQAPNRSYQDDPSNLFIPLETEGSLTKKNKNTEGRQKESQHTEGGKKEKNKRVEEDVLDGERAEGGEVQIAQTAAIILTD